MANEENVKKDKKEKKENLFTKIRKAPSKFAAKHPKLTKGISVTGKVVGGVSTVITAIAVKRLRKSGKKSWKTEQRSCISDSGKGGTDSELRLQVKRSGANFLFREALWIIF